MESKPEPVFETYAPPRDSSLRGSDLFQSVVACIGLLGGGLLFLSLELRGERNWAVLTLCGAMTAAGAFLTFVVLRDLLRRAAGPGEPRRLRKPPPWALPGSYLDSAAQRGLGHPRTAFPYRSARLVLTLLVSLCIALLTPVLLVMYLADGSTGLALGAGAVIAVSAGVAVYAYAAGRPTRRCWVVFEQGLVVVDTEGAATRVIRWDEVADWSEHGTPPGENRGGVRVPYSIWLQLSGEQRMLVLSDQEIADVGGLRAELVRALS